MSILSSMAKPAPFPIVLDRPLIFLDLETTGLSIGKDRIIEIAIIRLSPNGDVTEKVRRFNPEMPIPPEATAIHSITDEDVANEPPFSARARSLLQLLEPCDLAGFNIRRFDLPMLFSEFRRSALSFNEEDRKIIDIQMIFHREEPRDLAAAVQFYLHRELEDAHSALADIRATAAILTAQLNQYPRLPRDLGELNQYCDDIRTFETEVGRWFLTTQDHRRIFRFGKHEDRPLTEVVSNDLKYLHWILSEDDIDEGVKDVVRSALKEASG